MSKSPRKPHRKALTQNSPRANGRDWTGAARFERMAGPVLEECVGVFSQRGGQYGDTWLECRWVKLRAAARLMGIDTLTDAQCRVLASSVLCDVKYARDLGGYKEDSSLDGINYEALRVGEIRELLEKRPADCTPNNERLVEARK